MANESNTRSYYDDFSQSYEKERGRGYHGLIDEIEAGIVKPYARGARVLEAGCGTGLILKELSHVAKRACGFDLSPGMVKRAQARGLDVVLASVLDIPFADDSFDVTCSFKVLAHVPDIDRAIAEMVRVTRPGGHLFLEFYNRYSVRYLAKRLAGPQPIGEGRTEADIPTRWDTPAEVVARLPKNTEFQGFRGVRVVTPAAFVHKIPVLSHAVAAVERAAVESPAARLGGFLVAVLQKRA